VQYEKYVVAKNTTQGKGIFSSNDLGFFEKKSVFLGEKKQVC